MDVDTLLASPRAAGWSVSYEEQVGFSTVDGFLVIYQNLCRIVLSAQLPKHIKQRGIQSLVAQIPIQPMNETQIALWSRTDEIALGHDQKKGATNEAA